MKCLKCNGRKSYVTDSRKFNAGAEVSRARECAKCEHVWITREVIYSAPLPDKLYIRVRPRSEDKPRREPMDPALRNQRIMLRQQARQHAKETGENLEEVYERWGVATIRHHYRNQRP